MQDMRDRDRHSTNWLLAVGIACMSLSTMAQDIHFTQFFTNPLILSPASTGYFKGNYRAGINYKYQWPWASSQTTFNYHTQAAYVDFSFLETKVKRGWMGVGVNILNDDAGDGRLHYLRLGGSVAWHQAFDRENRYVLSIGYVCNYINKSVDFERFYFNNQWVDDRGFDLSKPDYEHPATVSFTQLDMGAGLNFNAKLSKDLLLSTSFSMLHLNRPRDQFYNRENSLGYRYIATSTIAWDINKHTSLMGNVYFTYQQKAYEIVAGGMVGLKPHERRIVSKSTFYIGAYYRVLDAVSPIVGYQYKELRLLVSYDIITTALYIPGKLNGGLEIALVYAGGFKHHANERKYACPKF